MVSTPSCFTNDPSVLHLTSPNLAVIRGPFHLKSASVTVLLLLFKRKSIRTYLRRSVCLVFGDEGNLLTYL